MLIKESTIKRILREEFRNLLSEVNNTAEIEAAIKQGRAGGKGNVSSNALEEFLRSIKAVDSVFVQVNQATNEFTQFEKVRGAFSMALQHWNSEVALKGSASPRAQAVINTLNSLGDKFDSSARFKAVAASLLTGKPYRGTMSGSETDYQQALGLGVGGGLDQVNNAIDEVIKKRENANVIEFVKYATTFDLDKYYSSIVSAEKKPEAADQPMSYTIKPGVDTISGIMQKFYGIVPPKKGDDPKQIKKTIDLYKKFGVEVAGTNDPNKIQGGKEIQLPLTFAGAARKK